MQVGAFLTGIGNQLERRFGVVQCDDKDLGVAQAGLAQDIRAGGVAQKRLEAKASHDGDGFRVMVQDDGAKAAGLHEPVHDLAEPSDTGDDHGALLVDFIGYNRAGFLVHSFADLIVKDEQKRRDQHR